MNILDHIYNYLVIGPSGTGKTTFLCSYAERHHVKYGHEGYWLTFPSLIEQLKLILPKWIKVTTDLLDPGFAGVNANPARTFVLGDEINRLISKYDHAKSEGKSFVDLVSIHRHKAFDLLVSDQVFDFLKGVRARAHWLIFTGINDTIFYSLKANLSPRLMFWIETYQSELVALGEANRLSIPRGSGKVFITNGIHSFVLSFVRPAWYTQDLSTIWRMVSPADLRKENNAADLQEYDFESDSHKILMLAYHLCKNLYQGKLTKEKLAAAYVPASQIFSGTPRKLADGGRGMPELLSATHAFSCYWCQNPAEYKTILSQLINMRTDQPSVDSEILTLEKEISEVLNT